MKTPSRIVQALILFVVSTDLWSQEVVVLDEIVAKVNQEIITLSDLQQSIDAIRNEIARTVESPEALDQEFGKQKRALLKGIIEKKLMIQKANELELAGGIDLDVAAALEANRKDSGIPSLEMLDQLLREQGSSLGQYRENLKQRMIVERLIQQSVYSRVTLLTPEIEAYYREHIERFTEPAEVELGEILFLTEGKNLAVVKEKSEEVLSDLGTGASFEDMARQHSDGPTASRGGAIGKFTRNSMAAPIGNVAFQLEEGEISEVIEADYGLQIIKVLKKKPAKETPLEEVRPQISRELYQVKAEPGIQDFLKELREESYVYIGPKYREQFDVEGL